MVDNAAPLLVPAVWFDGLSSRGQRVLVSLHPSPTGTGTGPSLSLHPLAPAGAAAVHVPAPHIEWPTAWGPDSRPTRRMVNLGPQGSLDIEHGSEWDRAALQAGARPPWSQQLQNRWWLLLAVGAAVVLGLVLMYRHGTPWLAHHLARWVPTPWEQRVAQQVLERLDQHQLRPSRIPPERQEALRRQFDALAQAAQQLPNRYPHYRPTLQLAFRAGGGSNAFALPGGQIVITDQLLDSAQRLPQPEDAVLGVLAHEIGHVMHRHGARLLIEQGVLNLGLSWALGDVSGFLAHGSAVLTGLAYQRQHEREADCHAVRLMRQVGRPTEPLARLLESLGSDPSVRPVTRGPRVWDDWLSSHPKTPDRAARLQGQDLQGCDRLGA